MITTAPPNGGGLISASFTPNPNGETIASSHFSLSTARRGKAATRHSQSVGFYATNQSKKTGANNKIQVRAVLLPTAFLNPQDEEGYVATISNLASAAQLVTLSAREVNGSTIRMVTDVFAKTLPKDIPRGTSFKQTTRKAASIKDLIPEAGTNYVLILCPNTFPINSGTSHTVKGTPDEGMGDAFRDLGELGLPWLQIMANLDNGVAPFDEALQSAATNNKIALDTVYPAYTSSILLTSLPSLDFTRPPIDEDDDSEGADLVTAIKAIRASLSECIRRNMPAPPTTQQLPFNIDVDGDSIMGQSNVGAAAPTPPSSERLLAKLRLLCVSYSSTSGVGLFDIRDWIAEILAQPRPQWAEPFGNRLRETNDIHSSSMDAINRFARWPKAYLNSK